MANIFSSTKAYQEAFTQGLEDMLMREQGLGVFILVLANASYQSALYERLKKPLQQRFETLLKRTRQADYVAENADDDRVFQRLSTHGFEQLQLTRFRDIGHWRLQYNQLRSFRPPRNSTAKVNSLHHPFDTQGFHFNKPFLRKEIFWEGQLGDHAARLLYNKFPFADWHGVLVLEPEQNRAQFLSQQANETAWDICAQLARSLPGIGLGFNAFGAAASVNHQHFQIFLRPTPYPAEQSHWLHNGGDKPYPLHCKRCNTHESLWHEITNCHEENQAYNIVYRKDYALLFRRKMQGHFNHAECLAGIGWSDTAGELTVFTEQDFLGVEEDFVLKQLQLAAIS